MVFGMGKGYRIQIITALVLLLTLLVLFSQPLPINSFIYTNLSYEMVEDHALSMFCGDNTLSQCEIGAAVLNTSMELNDLVSGWDGNFELGLILQISYAP